MNTKHFCQLIMIIVLLSMLIALPQPVLAEAMTIYVPDDYATIQAALDAANPGDRVYVRAGTYYEHVIISKSLTLQGENKATTIIDGSGSGYGIHIPSTDNVTISDFTVRNSRSAVFFSSGANYNLVKNVIATSSEYGLDNGDTSSNNNIFQNIEAYGNTYAGISAYAGSNNVQILDSYFHDNSGAGIQIGWSSNWIVSGNTTTGNGGNGLGIDAADYGTVTNNIITNNALDGIIFNGPHEQYNNITGNQISGNARGLAFACAGRYNTVTGNEIADNGYGVLLTQNDACPNYGNTFYHNTFAGNTVNAQDNEDRYGGNTWDNGYPSGGNAWDTYTGADLFSGPAQDVPGADGIGDTPYVILAGLDVDHYPMIFGDCASVTEIPQVECGALVAFYNSTNGAGWTTNTNWLATNTPCNWYGVGCGGGHVTQLNLDANQLSGSIPTELGNLTQLLSLSFSQNQVGGSIPVELGNLTQLQNLSLWENQLTGNIPAELGNLTQLEYVPLCGNQLTGNIPTELGNLTKLTGLCLSNNQLSGSIPPELGSLTQLTSFRLENNQLSGSIPTELGNLTQLQRLSLDNNQLTGNIPAELGNLTQLKELRLRENQLSGSIPAQLGNLAQLTSLELDINQLSGSIPPELGNLTQLTFLSLAGNQLTGNIPAELGNLTQLTWLGLCTNQLTGSIPAELGNLTQLIRLYLNDNQLTGSIPAELGNLTQLTELYLHNNQLSGEFPASITNLVNLTILTFDCGLTSTDPTVIAFIENLVPGWKSACSFTISGDAGIAGAVLHYTDGTAKTATTEADGTYSFTVSYNWSGTVTPVKTGYVFVPVSRTYANVLTNQVNQDYSLTSKFYSTGAQDGWILESAEISDVGGTLNATAATLSLGDDAAKRQYRSILSFSTKNLPDNAVITKVTLKLKRASVLPVGTNPINLLQGIYVDVRKGYFGSAATLQLADFKAPANKTVGPAKPVLTAGWYALNLNSTAFPYVNKAVTNGGLTQIRLRFKLDDNNNAIANVLNITSGNHAIVANRPTLMIEYHMP